MPVPSVALLLFTPAWAGIPCRTNEMRSSSSIVGVRPSDAGFVDSAIYPIRVHYRKADDANRALNVVLPAVETSWAVEVVQMGWPPPPPDAGVGGDDSYDVYLTNEGTYGGAYAFGFGPDVIPDDGWYSNPSYIALDDKWITDADMLFFVAHEFNHSCQYAIDAVEKTGFVWESTSEAMATLVDVGSTDIYMTEIQDFQKLPFESLLFNSYSPEITKYDNFSFYEYGGSIWGKFLEERYGTNDGTQLLKLWENLAQPTKSDEPDFVDSMATMDPANPTAAAVYAEFAEWRMFASSQDDGAHYQDGALWPSKSIPVVEDSLTLDEVDGYSASPAFQPYDLGVSYYDVDLGGGTDQVLHVEVTGEAGTQWGLAWAVWHASGPADTGTLVVADGDPLAVDIPLAGGTRAEFGVVNGGPLTLDAETPHLPDRSFQVDLSLADALTTPTTTTPETTDTTPGGTTPSSTNPDGGGEITPADEGKGCGCATGSAAPGSLAGLLGMALLVRRRRR